MMEKKKNAAVKAAAPATGKAEKAKKSTAKTATAVKSASTRATKTPASEASASKKSAKATASPKPAARKTAGKVAETATAPFVPAAAEISRQPIRKEEIERLAYSYAEARGFQGGSPDEDWLRAERELRRLRGR